MKILLFCVVFLLLVVLLVVKQVFKHIQEYREILLSSLLSLGVYHSLTADLLSVYLSVVFTLQKKESPTTVMSSSFSTKKTTSSLITESSSSSGRLGHGRDTPKTTWMSKSTSRTAPSSLIKKTSSEKTMTNNDVKIRDAIKKVIGNNKDMIDILGPLDSSCQVFVVTVKSTLIANALVTANTSHDNDNQIKFLFVEETLVYEGFDADFGPLNLACLYYYCRKVCHILDMDFSSRDDSHEGRNKKTIVVHLCTPDPRKRVNAVFLASSFTVIIMAFFHFIDS